MDNQYQGWCPEAGTSLPRVDIAEVTPETFFSYDSKPGPAQIKPRCANARRGTIALHAPYTSPTLRPLRSTAQNHD